VAARMNTEAQLEVVDVERAAIVTPHTAVLYNPERRVAFFMLPGTLAIMLGFAYTRLIVMSLAGEREDGNLERLLMTPMNYKGLILGKLLPFFVIGSLNAMAYIVVIHFAFGVPVNGSILLLLGALMLYLLTILSLGAFIAAGAADTQDAMQMWMFLTLPSIMLSGYVFPLSSVPKVLLPVSYAMPQTHFIEIMRGLCLRGASAAELAPHLIVLAIAPVLLTIGAAWKFKRSIMD
jgi:ABC-2 type transport system permease protein